MIITATAQGIYSCSHTVQRHGFNRYKIPTEQVVLIYISFFTHTDVKISMVLLASHSLSLLLMFTGDIPTFLTEEKRKLVER